MNTYAVVEIYGKQFKIVPGQELEVDKFTSAGEGKVELDKVLLFCDNGVITVGTPYVPGKKITASIISAVKGPKLKIFRYKAKSRYQKETGFRAKLTRIKIEAFGLAKNENVKEVKTELKIQKLQKTVQSTKKTSSKKK